MEPNFHVFLYNNLSKMSTLIVQLERLCTSHKLLNIRHDQFRKSSSPSICLSGRQEDDYVCLCVFDYAFDMIDNFFVFCRTVKPLTKIPA